LVLLDNLNLVTRFWKLEWLETTEEIEIEKGVRQRCILSPILYNLYSEGIINKALSEQDTSIKVSGIPINNIRYDDDTVVIAETPEDDQILQNSRMQCRIRSIRNQDQSGKS